MSDPEVVEGSRRRGDGQREEAVVANDQLFPHYNYAQQTRQATPAHVLVHHPFYTYAPAGHYGPGQPGSALAMGLDPFLGPHNEAQSSSQPLTMSQAPYLSQEEQIGSHSAQPIYHQSSPEDILLRSASSANLTADMLHSWQNQQRLLNDRNDMSVALPMTSRNHSFPHFALPPAPGIYRPTPGDEDSQHHIALQQQSDSFVERPATPPKFPESYTFPGNTDIPGQLSLNTEGISVVGAGSDGSLDVSPMNALFSAAGPSWYTPSAPSGDYGQHSSLPSGVPGYHKPSHLQLDLSAFRGQSNTAHVLPFQDVGQATPDVLQSSFYADPSNQPQMQSPYAQSHALGQPAVSLDPSPSTPWSAFNNTSALDSPAVRSIARMEAPFDYFQQMPVQSNPPYSVPLPGPAMARELPTFSTPAVPVLGLPPQPRSLPYPGTPDAYAPSTGARGNAVPAANLPIPTIAKKASSKTNPGKRENRKAEAICDHCGQVFAMLYLRGYESDYQDPYSFSYVCIDCSSSIVPQTSNPSSVESTPPDSGVTQSSKKKEAKVVKKRFRANDPAAAANCDVCMRTVGRGGPIPDDGRADLTFNLELVCSQCTSRYARCSDCGGGGGVRLGVGKWRCKELFTPPRKTCDLSHARQSSVASMEYAIVRISEISQADMPVITAQCKHVFESALYSSLAVPEVEDKAFTADLQAEQDISQVLERGVAAASTFADIKKRVDTGWEEAQHFIDEDVEETLGFRRYLGLRWAAPKPRKSASRRATDQADKSAKPIDPSSIQRPGMNLSGYVTGEWDIYGGTLYISVSVPYSTGESYEGSAHLISMMTKVVHEDRENMIQYMLDSGQTQNLDRIRPVQHCFTMLFFAPESKLVSFLESKRQLVPLERYLSLYPETDPTVFPPYRPVADNIKTQPGWNCLVRRVVPMPPSLPNQPIRKANSRIKF